MKRVICVFTAIAGVALGGNAFAGDITPPPIMMEQPAQPIMQPVPVQPMAQPLVTPDPREPHGIDWTGAWFGGVLGYGVGSVAGTDSQFTPFNQSLRPNADGFFGGASTGFNWQYNNQWVFGVVGDITGNDIKGSKSGDAVVSAAAANSFFGLTGVFTAPTTVAAKVDVTNPWLVTLRGRAGWSWPSSPFMIYATGGAAFGDVNLKASFAGNDGNVSSSTSFSDSHTLWGYAVGAGTEFMLDRNFSLGLEYLYVNLQKQTYFTATTGAPAVSAGLTNNQLRMNLNYHF